MDFEPGTLCLNGIDGSTGEYLAGPRTLTELAQMLATETDPVILGDLSNRIQDGKPHHGPISSVDPQNLAEAGWGVIFADNLKPDVITQLKPLLNLRHQQAKDLYKEYQYKGESKFQFTKGVTGLVNPAHIPYYLLIVGDPEAISYNFQFQLDIQYAVGRIHFDNPEDYGTYARAVVAAEEGGIARPKQAAFFGVCESPSAASATWLSWNYLTKPLAEGMSPDWKTVTVGEAEATKSRLKELMGGRDTPALLFTASHGLGYPLSDDPKDDRQYLLGGALQTGDYPGPGKGVRLDENCYFSAKDIDDSANVAGMLAVFFACFGAGTPKVNSFRMKDKEASDRQIARQSFVANLPKRLLSRGALAVVGHVDRVWSCSFFAPASPGMHSDTFHSTLDLLTSKGSRLGFAMESFGSRYGEMTAQLLSSADLDPTVPEAAELLAYYWTACNDARNYAVVGDPAVKCCARDGITEPKIDLSMPVEVKTVTTANVAQPAPVPLEAVVDPVMHPVVDSSASSDTKETVSDTLKKLRDGLGETLDHAMAGLKTLEVVTYTSDSSVTADLSEDRMTGAQARAITRFDVTGQTRSVIPTKDGAIDHELWKMHLEMVDKAIAHRSAMWKLATDLVGQVVGWVKKP